MMKRQMNRSKNQASNEEEEEREVKEQGDDEDELVAKKPKMTNKLTNDDGSQMHELGSNRFVSVSEFKGKKLVNIREYYKKEGQLLPGKKGISLSLDQYKNLKKLIKVIDESLGED